MCIETLLTQIATEYRAAERQLGLIRARMEEVEARLVEL